MPRPPPEFSEKYINVTLPWGGVRTRRAAGTLGTTPTFHIGDNEAEGVSGFLRGEGEREREIPHLKHSPLKRRYDWSLTPYLTFKTKVGTIQGQRRAGERKKPPGWE